ncbi:hypothetical protein POK33_37855 [Burkholderia cenocepacia]|uniref:hypothetical protein n=1 Tax=Burkholderia cenocepacia TaxID=95486 RepID=UPI0023B90BC8|nr:hypothetical protein [Burkholderia cenocepacia]MDF0506522.1 hypothetical protein [Burkholderia cenocepacia]
MNRTDAYALLHDVPPGAEVTSADLLRWLVRALSEADNSMLVIAERALSTAPVVPLLNALEPVVERINALRSQQG